MTKASETAAAPHRRAALNYIMAAAIIWAGVASTRSDALLKSYQSARRMRGENHRSEGSFQERKIKRHRHGSEAGMRNGGSEAIGERNYSCGRRQKYAASPLLCWQ